MAAAKMTAHATEQPSVATDSSLTATEHAISHNVGAIVGAVVGNTLSWVVHGSEPNLN